MTDVSLLLWLLLGHILGDFYLQPKEWVDCRYQRHLRSPSLYKHASVHGLLSLAILLILSQQSIWLCIAAAAVISVCHLIVDAIKSFLSAQVRWFLLDQFMHLLCLVLVWLWITNIDLKALDSWLQAAVSYKVIIIGIAYILCARPVSIFITIVLKQFTPTLIDETSNTAGNETSLASAGKTIGYLERWLVLSFLLLNQFSGIGFLLAAKSVFRFGDLSKSKDMKLTEYVMLGTLTSISSALAIGFIAQHLIK
jgi:hypothetical protein